MSAKGYKLSEEAKLRVSLAQKGRKHKPNEGYQKGHAPIIGTERTRFKKGIIPWNKGKNNIYSKETLYKIGSVTRGKKQKKETIEKRRLSNTGKKRTPETCLKISRANFGRKNIKNSGSNAWNWKGGVTPEVNKIRQSVEYKIWVNAVLSRDNFTCQKTKIRGGKLSVHHIKNFSDYPELRFAIDNGITFLKEEHEKFHKIYGRRNNSIEQINEFICQK